MALGLRPDGAVLAEWGGGGVTDVLYGLPDKDAAEIPGYLDRLRAKLDALSSDQLAPLTAPGCAGAS